MLKQFDCSVMLARIAEMVAEAEKEYKNASSEYKRIQEENKNNNFRAPEVKQELEYKAACQLNVQWGGLQALRWEEQELKKLFNYETERDDD